MEHKQTVEEPGIHRTGTLLFLNTHITECTASVSCRLSWYTFNIILYTECSKTADLLAGTPGQDCLPYVHR